MFKDSHRQVAMAALIATLCGTAPVFAVDLEPGDILVTDNASLQRIPPSVNLRVGAGTVPLYVHTVVFTPGDISISAS